ncbi:cyclin-dependent kinase-like 3 [Faustovirus]|nr:cyclin-dependent kinase-like 3 [Faustovirus]
MEIKSNLTNNSYRIEEEISDGGFAHVYVGYTAGKKVALKIYKKAEDNDYFMNEVKMNAEIAKIERSTDHFCVAKDWFVSINLRSQDYPEMIYCLVYDHYAGNLYDLIRFCRKQDRKMSPKLIKYIANQIITSVAALHVRNIIHTDIKPENILLSHTPTEILELSPKSYNKLKVVLCDFGTTTPADKLFDLRVGTQIYQPPEMIVEDKYTASADVWGIGCVLYELITLHTLFDVYEDKGCKDWCNYDTDDSDSDESDVEGGDDDDVDADEIAHSDESSGSYTSDDSAHYSRFTGKKLNNFELVYKHLHLIYKYLGKPNPEFYMSKLASKYYTGAGGLKFHPSVDTLRIKDDLKSSGVISKKCIDQVLALITSCLRYGADARANVMDLATDAWLNEA